MLLLKYKVGLFKTNIKFFSTSPASSKTSKKVNTLKVPNFAILLSGCGVFDGR